MAGKSDYLENKLLDHTLRDTTYTQAASVYAALYTAAPSDAGGGTEVTGGSYARTRVVFGAASSGTSLNSHVCTFPTSTDNWGTVTHFGIFDADNAGNLLYWAQLGTSRVADTGTTLSFEIGAMAVVED